MADEKSNRTFNPDDYKKIYDEDPYMEEMSDNARVWRVYLDESDRIDTELVNGWTSTLDTLLIFAGLFASVLATFVTQTVEALQPPDSSSGTDSQSLLAAMVNSQREMVSLQRALATGGNISAIPESPITLASTTFTPATRDVWLNGIWFFSLGLTLVTAFMTGLVKQWLNSYLSDVKGSPRRRACTRRFRYKGLSAWGVWHIMGLLPILMNASLLLFFIGLILYIQDLTGAEGITISIIVLTGILFAFYMVTSALPIVAPDCPYKSSLTGSLFYPSKPFLLLAGVVLRIIDKCLDLLGKGSSLLNKLANTAYGIFISPSAVSLEEGKVGNLQDTLELDTLEEMLIQSPHMAVNAIAAEALANLSGRVQNHGLFDSQEVYFRVSRRFYRCIQWKSTTEGPKMNVIPGSEATAERLARARLNLSSANLGISSKDLYEYFATQSDDLRVAAIHASLLSQDSEQPEIDRAKKNGVLVRQIFARPNEMSNEVHFWVKDRLLDAAIMSARQEVLSPEDWRTLFDRFLQECSLGQPITLQDEMFTGMIGSRPTAEEQPWRNETERRFHDSLQTAYISSRCLLRSLPALAKHVNSTSPQYSDRFYRILDRVFVHPCVYKEDPGVRVLNPVTWAAVELNIDESKDEFVGVFESLLQELTALVGNQSCDWLGDAFHRLKPTLVLYGALYPKELEEGLAHAAQRYIMPDAESPHPHTYGVQTLGDVKTNPSRELLMRELIVSQLARYPIQAFELYCSKFASNALPASPPRSPPTSLEQAVKTQLAQQQHALSLDNLRTLFLRFLDPDTSDGDSIFPMSLQDRQNALEILIRIVSAAYASQSSDSSPAKVVLDDWLLLLKERSPEAVPLPESPLKEPRLFSDIDGRKGPTSTEAYGETGFGGSVILELVQMIQEGLDKLVSLSEKPQVEEMDDMKAE